MHYRGHIQTETGTFLWPWEILLLINHARRLNQNVVHDSAAEIRHRVILIEL